MFQFPGLMINVVFSECTVPSQKAFPAGPVNCTMAECCFCSSLYCHVEGGADAFCVTPEADEASADRHRGREVKLG